MYSRFAAAAHPPLTNYRDCATQMSSIRAVPIVVCLRAAVAPANRLEIRPVQFLRVERFSFLEQRVNVDVVVESLLSTTAR